MSTSDLALTEAEHPWLTAPTVEQLSDDLRANRLSSESMTAECLRWANDANSQGRLAFTRLYGESALAEARAADRHRRDDGERSSVDGLPISIKDLFDVAGHPTPAGSVVLRDAPPAAADATVVARLRHAGAVIVGRTNMTEFAFSGLGINPHYGTPLNPFDRATGRIPGGSSSGAAISVSDGMCVAAIGTDTGGSVRIPAAFCGLTGFKPSASRLPREGVLPLSTTLDSVGVIARSVRCCAQVDAVMADLPMSAPRAGHVARPRLCVVTNLLLESMDDEVAAAFARAIRRLSAAGAIIVERSLPELNELSDINAKGGFAASEAYEWHEALLDRFGSEYDPRVAVRIRRGQLQSAVDYIRLIRARTAWIARMMRALRDVDAVLMPTVPIVAPVLAPLMADDDLYSKINMLVLRNPSVINMLDGCAVSVPCQGLGQLPVGLSICGVQGRDETVLSIAEWVEAILVRSRAADA